jgi:VWFA-related protein
MRLRLALLFGLPAAPFWAQATAQAPPQPPPQPEITSHEGAAIFSSRINLVSVPVVVRDREGRAVGSLRQEDFQLSDKGKLQVITKFSIQRSDSPGVEGTDPTPGGTTSAPGLPERYVAYLFDDVNLKTGDLLQARQAVNHHLDESLEPKARAAVFTTSGKMLINFTDDREKLHAAVNSVLPWTGGPSSEDCPTMSYYVADYLVNQTLYFDGFVYKDEDVPVGQGKDQILDAVYAEAQACDAQNGGVLDQVLVRRMRMAAHQILEFRDQETSFALEAVKEIVRRLSVMPGSRSMVLVSPGFLLTRSGNHFSKEYDVLDRAIRANVTVNTVDARGLNTSVTEAGERGYQSSQFGPLQQADIAEAAQRDNVLEEVADGTGGTFFHNDNGFKEGLNRIAARPEYVYVLGYSPQSLKFDGSYHGLKVTIKNSSGLSVQARRGYWAPNHEVSPAEESREEIEEAVFSRDEIRDIPVELQTEFFKSSETAAELTVIAHLDLKGLQFRKVEDRNNDTLTVVTGLFDPNGNYISGVQRVTELHLRDQTLKSLEGSGIVAKESFNVAPGRYFVRVVVRDSEGKTMAARNAGVEIQ